MLITILIELIIIEIINFCYTHNRYELSWVHILNLLGGMFNQLVPVTPRTCYRYKDTL